MVKHKHSKNLKNLKIPQSIYIPKAYRLGYSTIPEAGIGVFAQQDLPANHKLAPYKGDFLTPERFQTLVDNGKDFIYLWQVNDYHGNPNRTWNTFDATRPIGYVDGGRTKTANFLRYINCARDSHEENVSARQIGPQIYYFTNRPIKRGEELLVWYGPSYGKLLTGKSKL